ncbi:hypothetical protein ID866_5790 [Astraeus odoratus]|nr:hypothetical protein ID866_5790 [Astraeus odoratus]
MIASLRSSRILSVVSLSSPSRLLSTTAAQVPTFPVQDHGVLPTSRSPIVTRLHFFNSVTGGQGQIPTYRVLDGVGIPVEGAQVPQVGLSYSNHCRVASHCALVDYYEQMMLLPTMDNVLYNVQRQGKISFYHFGSPKHHFHTISSPLATQIPQAAGVGFALRRDPARRDKNVACVYFGEGAASEGDFHAGMLLASTIPCPTIFLARNNGFAISTPAHEQYYGDGIAARGPGYGVDTVRVDGNDVLAVMDAVKEARRRCLESGRAVLVEAMTYRVGHHSTSDDSFAYRGRQEVENMKKIDNPITRFRLYMESRGWWNDQEEETLKVRLKKDVLAAFKRAESLKRSDLRDLFTDVYAGEEPWNLREQREELAVLLEKYGEAWEPWRNELKRFRDEGKKLVD